MKKRPERTFDQKIIILKHSLFENKAYCLYKIYRVYDEVFKVNIFHEFLAFTKLEVLSFSGLYILAWLNILWHKPEINKYYIPNIIQLGRNS